jgi:hypothetical protein
MPNTTVAIVASVSDSCSVNWRLKQYYPFALQTVPVWVNIDGRYKVVLFDRLFIDVRPGWRFGTVCHLSPQVTNDRPSRHSRALAIARWLIPC